MKNGSAIYIATTGKSCARELSQAGRLPCDAIEVGSRDDLHWGKPLYLHNPVLDWSLADEHADFAAIADAVNESLERTAAPWASLHLGFSAKKVRFGTEEMLPTSETLPGDLCYGAIVASINRLAPLLHKPILLENLDYIGTGAYEHVCCPDFIAQVVTATGTALLLDLGHARVSAAWLGLDPREYLMRLPLDRVRELHLSGPRVINGALFDAHDSLTAADWDLLDFTLRLTNPRVITIEYNRDAGELLRQLHKLKSFLLN